MPKSFLMEMADFEGIFQNALMEVSSKRAKWSTKWANAAAKKFVRILTAETRGVQTAKRMAHSAKREHRTAVRTLCAMLFPICVNQRKSAVNSQFLICDSLRVSAVNARFFICKNMR